MTDRDLRHAALFAVQRLWRRHGDAVPWGPSPRASATTTSAWPTTAPGTTIPHFRREVLGAYGRRCSVCALRESPLLDGAHLVPDREEARPDPELVAHRWAAAREG